MILDMFLSHRTDKVVTMVIALLHTNINIVEPLLNDLKHLMTHNLMFILVLSSKINQHMQLLSLGLGEGVKQLVCVPLVAFLYILEIEGEVQLAEVRGTRVDYRSQSRHTKECARVT